MYCDMLLYDRARADPAPVGLLQTELGNLTPCLTYGLYSFSSVQ